MGWQFFNSTGSVKSVANTHTHDAVAIVTALPSSPTDGQVIHYQSSAMATDGIVWQFRYRSSAGTYKWEFIGGQVWSAEVATSQSTASLTYVDLATVGPTVTTPLAGDYLIEISARIDSAANSNTGFMSYAVGATGALNVDAVVFGQEDAGGANSDAHPCRKKRKNAIAAATDIKAKYAVNPATTANFSERFLGIIPIRVG